MARGLWPVGCGLCRGRRLCRCLALAWFFAQAFWCAAGAMAAAATTTLLPRHLRRLPPLPGFRLHHGSFFGDTVDDRIAVMQFNQLADSLATGDAFPRVDPRWLAWEHRAPLILQEITRYKPDVVCLQVQAGPAPAARVDAIQSKWSNHRGLLARPLTRAGTPSTDAASGS